RNRVNELGVSEPIVQRQGIDRINVQLPGVQNSAEVKDILGRVATLEFRLEDMQSNAFEAMQTGRVPLGSKLYTHTRLGRPILLKREVIATGDQLTNATTGQSQEGPAVNVRLDARSGSLAIPLYPIEERAVGPSLGRDNIDKGVTALIVGMAGVFVFMAIYYKTFGLVADAVLLSNVVLLTALLSMMRASLSLPGIA